MQEGPKGQPVGGYNAAADFVDRQVLEGRAAKAAFVDPARTLTYGELLERSARFAGALRAAGLGPERRVAQLMLDTVDFPVVFWGAIRAGIIPIPVNTLLPADQYDYVLRDSRAEVVVVSAPLFEKLEPVLAGLTSVRLVIVADPAGGEAMPRTRLENVVSLAAFTRYAEPDYALAPTSEDEVAFWLYSSGSTGSPKGVKHVHASPKHTALCYGEGVLGMREDDVVFSAAKLFFAYGLGNGMSFPMWAGATALLLPERATPAEVISLVRAHQPTIFFGVPTLYSAILAHEGVGPGLGSSRLRLCVSAGEALPAQVGERWREVVGVDIIDGIGSTEMLHIFLSNRPDDVRYGTSGTPVPGYEAKIVGQTGEPVSDGEIGELIVRGPTAAEGYWNQRAKSRRTFAGEWTYTGDKYVRDEQGYYRYCGRTDDMMKVSGIWVSPFEVEAALLSHPAVLEAAVVGHDDADGLLKPRAFVVLNAGVPGSPALLEELRGHVKTAAGPWKYPRWIDVMDELPKTATGKIQRFKLRGLDLAERTETALETSP